MKTLFTTDYKDYERDWPVSRRPSARALILVGDKIALVYAKNIGYYKFPGGGIDENEDNVTALIREVEEETGLSVIPESVEEYGVVHRIHASELYKGTIFIQDSYHYFCKVKTDENGKPIISKQTLDSYERVEGFELRFVSIEEAVQTNLNFKSDDFAKLDMITRETLVMEKAFGLLEIMPRYFAESILERGVSKNPGVWREHSIAVAQSAEKIAMAINKSALLHKKPKLMNPDLAYTCGLLHDIGRQNGPTYIAHVYDGYNFLKSLGFEFAAKICLTHSFNLQNADDYIGERDVTTEQMQEIKSILAITEYDDYDRLIQLLDSVCCADGSKDLEKRMNDVKKRYGYYPEGKWNKNFALKAYFEKLMGKDLYEVIR